MKRTTVTSMFIDPGQPRLSRAGPRIILQFGLDSIGSLWFWDMAQAQDFLTDAQKQLDAMREASPCGT